MNVSDEQLLQQESRGQRARDILDSDVYRGAFEQIKQEIFQQWQDAPVRDVEGRERLWMMLKLLEKVDGCLASTMTTGALAKQELAHRQTMLERARQWINR